MNKLLNKITEASKVVVAVSGAIGVIISLLTWISIQIYSFSNGVKKAIQVIPIVEQNSRDIYDIRKNYILSNEYRQDINEIEQKYIVTEIDYLISSALDKLNKNEPLAMVEVNRLVFYRNNLSFLTHQQVNNINYIEKRADKMH